MAKNPTRDDRDATKGAAALGGGLEAMLARAKLETPGGERGIPPVDKWNPPFCGDLDMEIKSDGTWFYNGTPIGRAPLVRLFSSILRKDEDGKTYLVTPVEKVGVRVEDAHFVAVELDASTVDGQQVLTFRTHVGDIVEAGPRHPLRFETVAENDGLKPYLCVRGRLEALIARPVMYQLIELGEELQVNGKRVFAVRSNGQVFPIMPADELARASR